MRMGKKIIMVASILLVLSSWSRAAGIQLDGNHLLKSCLAAERFFDKEVLEDKVMVGYCMGLLKGVRSTMGVMALDRKGTMEICLPNKGITNYQAVRVIVSYLKSKSALLHEDDAGLTMMGFMDAFPCE